MPPGAQNKDWHADSDGTVLFWNNKSYQERVCALWEFLADRYKDEETIAGYDLLNESVTDNAKLLNRFYKTLIKRIRKIDHNHVLFVEANNWATDIDCLEEFDDDNHALSIHSYDPPALTFNFVPNRRYPCFNGRAGTINLRCDGICPSTRGSRASVRCPFIWEIRHQLSAGILWRTRLAEGHARVLQGISIPLDVLDVQDGQKRHIPDGVLSYYENPAWVNRAGPANGLEAYASCWTSFAKK